LHDLGLSEGYFIVLRRHILLSDSVEDFGLKEETRVVAPDAREEQALRLYW